MKKISIVLGLVLAFGLISPALADDDSDNSGRGSIREEFEAKRREIQEKIKENKERIKATQNDLRKDLKRVDKEVKQETKEEVKTLKRSDDDDDNRKGEIPGAKVRALVAIRVYEATINRLDGLVMRVDSRIAALHGAGASTTEAVSFVNAAKTSLVNARGHIANLKNLSLALGGAATSTNATSTNATSTNATTTATSTVRSIFDQIKSEAKLAKEDLQDAKQSLQRALHAIKEIEKDLRRDGRDINATSTNATSTDDRDDDEEDDD